MKKNNIISDWLDKYGDPEIDKKVGMKLEEMNKERFNQIIDEVYNKYTIKYMGYDDVPSKELFLFEIKNNPEFSKKWGLTIEERELSLEDRMILCKEKWDYSWNRTINLEDIEWRMNNEWNIPTKLITLTYNNEKIESYE